MSKASNIKVVVDSDEDHPLKGALGRSGPGDGQQENGERLF